MAAAKMKKITVYAARDDKDDILRSLMMLGRVEISEADEQSVFSRECADTERLYAEHMSLARGIEIIGQYTPGKKPRVKAQIQSGDLLDGVHTEDCLELARRLEALDVKIRGLETEAQNEKSFIDSLTPWAGLDIPLDCDGTENAALILGVVPLSADVKAEELYGVVPESEVFVVSSDTQWRYLALVCLCGRLEEVPAVLARWFFSVVSFKNANGTAADNIKKARCRLDDLTAEAARFKSEVEAAAVREDDLKLCYDHIGTKIARAEASERLAGTRFVVALAGWLPADSEPEVIVALSKYQCALDIRDPSPDEAESAPVTRGRFFTKARKGPAFEPLAIETRYVSVKNESAQGG